MNTINSKMYCGDLLLKNNMVSVVVNYCTNDERFIRKSLNNLLQISDDIIVPISDHFFDGGIENIQSIETLMLEYPTVTFKLYNWNNTQFPRYWHNYSRVIGTKLARYEWVLYLDSDEMIDAELFQKFLNGGINQYDSYKLACYWYFREPMYQSTKWEDSPVLVKKHLVNIDVNNKYLEREQMHEILNVSKKRMVTFTNLPFVHHFSWVRTKEEMLKKVKSWGHNKDKNWVSLVEEEFSREFNGTDFIHGYEYNIVENKFNV
jgi:hypothetical protein